MTNARRILLTVLMAGTMGACSGDNNGPSEASLTATWHATNAEFVSVTNPAQKVELVGIGGSVVLALNANNTFTMTTTTPGKPAAQLSGTWSASADVLTLSYQFAGTQGQAQYEMTLNGDTLLLMGADGSFDVNGDNALEDVKINLTLTRG